MKPTTMEAAAWSASPHGMDRQHSAEHEHEGAEELVDEVVDAVVVGVGGAEGAEDWRWRFRCPYSAGSR